MPIPSHLFLGRSSLISLILRPLLARTRVSGLAPRVPKLPVGTSLNGSGDLALLDLGDGNGVDDRERGLGALDVVGLDGRDVGGRGVTLLGLAGLSWEEDEAGAVGLETGDVQGEGLGGEVLAAGVDGDTDGWCELAWDTSLL